ncbi:PTS cellobiose transporter subunit IIC [Neobacillus cucumis]|uniref:PTS cellobiose transporter subunit IIC n=1 Tax=Neobacillus cucumis TaxID=1740721 RepID=UPI002E24BB53|nr:PTS cellobiose transporter subunit IIC [Neobacillus cucumis]MED4227696.1 PTS cellobiose transporter subunit IIC [Neobacillus cucumis]
MDKIMNFLEEKVMPVAGRLAAQRHLTALRDAMVLTIPFIIIGSVFLILANFPIQAYLDWMAAHPTVKTTLLYPYNATFNLVALIATFAVAYRLAQSYNVDALATGATALAAYFTVTPFTGFVTGVNPETKANIIVNAMNQDYFTSKGLFVGLIIGIVTTEICRRVIHKNIVIKMPDGVPPTVARSFVALIPGFIAIFVVYLMRVGIEALNRAHFNLFGILDFSNITSIHDIVKVLLQKPLTEVGTSLIGTCVVMILISLLWAVGLHGSSIVGSVMVPIWLQLTSENALATAAGQVPPHIVTEEFRTIIQIGGSGGTFGLVLAMLFLSKSKQMKQLGKLAIGPGLFNINEPILFGLPIVLNPVMLIPFFIVPVIQTLITYFAFDLGLVHMLTGVVPPWTLPPIIQGYLLTGSISGAILQLVMIVVTGLIYYPFFKIMDNKNYKEEKEAETPSNTKKAIVG